MQVINTQNVYSFVLTELEWYGGGEQQREAWINQCLREAQEWRCQYAAILVEPDALLSISPIPKRHQVWRHTFQTDDNDVAARNVMRDWSRNIPNGPYVGYIQEMASSMSKQELEALRHAFDKYFTR